MAVHLRIPNHTTTRPSALRHLRTTAPPWKSPNDSPESHLSEYHQPWLQCRRLQLRTPIAAQTKPSSSSTVITPCVLRWRSLSGKIIFLDDAVHAMPPRFGPGCLLCGRGHRNASASAQASLCYMQPWPVQCVAAHGEGVTGTLFPQTRIHIQCAL